MTSFVPVPAESDFPLENLPYGVFSTKSNPRRRICVAIGEHVLDLFAVSRLYPPNVQDAHKSNVLNDLMALGHEAWVTVRTRTTQLLKKCSVLESNSLARNALIPQAEGEMHVPANIGDYHLVLSAGQRR